MINNNEEDRIITLAIIPLLAAVAEIVMITTIDN